MNLSAEQFAERLFGDLALNATATFYVAYSGGVDSTVLLHLMAAVQKIRPINVVALHVNHNLQSRSGSWSQRCAAQCADLNIPFQQVSLALEQNNELVARNARYSWFREQIGSANVLLTAHHRQDRAETLLFNLMRGAGSTGLSSLRAVTPFYGSKLVRPMLRMSQAEIVEYATQNKLDWIEDPSNDETIYSRNYIRNNILPVLNNFRSDAEANIARAAANLEQENLLLREVAIGDLVEVREHPKHPLDSSHALCFEDFAHLSSARKSNLVRFWLRSLQLHTPSKRLLDQLLTSFESPPSSTAVLQEDGCQFRFYRGYLYVMPAINEAEPLLTIDWRDIDQPVDLYANKIRVDATEKLRNLYHSHGVCSLALTSKAYVDNPKAIQGHSLNLKKWLQEMGIPPWRRQALPLLTLSQSGRDLVLGPVDQQFQSDWVSLECPVV